MGNNILSFLQKIIKILLKVALIFITLAVTLFIILLFIGGVQTNNFNSERDEIITKLIEADTWTGKDNGQKFSDEFIQIKNQNLNKYFNNSEDELFEALDKHIGEKHYTLKNELRPNTGILENTLLWYGSIPNNVFIAARDKDVCIQFKDRNTGKHVIVYVRGGEKIPLSLPYGAYYVSNKVISDWFNLDYIKNMFAKEKMVDDSAYLSNKYVDIDFGSKLYYLYNGSFLETLSNYHDWDNFELKELPKPQTGIIGSTIPLGNRTNVNILNQKKDLCIKFTEFRDKTMLIACVRKNNKLELSLPDGFYFAQYNYYDKWYGISDLFSNGGKEVSHFNIDDVTTIYIGQNENNDNLLRLSLYEWKNAIAKLQEH